MLKTRILGARVFVCSSSCGGGWLVDFRTKTPCPGVSGSKQSDFAAGHPRDSRALSGRCGLCREIAQGVGRTGSVRTTGAILLDLKVRFHKGD